MFDRDALLRSVDKLPRISPLLTKLIALLADPDCDVYDLSSIVEKDPVLSAQVLQRANSAWFGRMQPVSSVHHAIALLGVGSMRRFAVGSSISNLFSRHSTAPSFSMTRFNLHSVATGTLLEILADELPVHGREHAFVAGLLHDMCKLLIAAHMPKQYEDILAIAAASGRAEIECEREVLGMDHAELSDLAISRWELDRSIAVAARYHHDPARAVEIERVPPGRIGLTAVLCKSNEFVKALGMSILPPLSLPEAPPPLEFPGFRCPADAVEERFRKEWRNLWESGQ